MEEKRKKIDENLSDGSNNNAPQGESESKSKKVEPPTEHDGNDQDSNNETPDFNIYRSKSIRFTPPGDPSGDPNFMEVKLTPEMFNFNLTEIREEDLAAIELGLMSSLYLSDDPAHKMRINLRSPKRKIESIYARYFFSAKLLARYLDYTVEVEGRIEIVPTLLLLTAPDGKRYAKKGTIFSLKGGFPENPGEGAVYSAMEVICPLLGRRLDPKYLRQIPSFDCNEALKIGIINKVI